MSVSNTRTSARTTPMLFDRQRQLLTLLDALGGSAGNLDFQKLLFLYCQEADSSGPYEFVPYRFGAFSFTSNADRQKLVERGLLMNDEKRWRITEQGRDAIGRTLDMQMTTFVSRHGALRGDGLVAECYRRFPYYATRSEIAARVLKEDKKALAEIEAARPASPPSTLMTIGYEGRTLESYLNELLRAGVSVLCDVRRNPISRKYGFSKGALQRSCENLGIRYEHVPELGIASEHRQSLETQEDYDALFEEYERKSLPKQGDALARIAGWAQSGDHIALTCYERLPQQCHRHCVAEALEGKFGDQLAPIHL